MGVSTRTVRRALAAGVVLLVAVVLGFIAYGHMRAQKFILGLPGKLGVDVKQETNGFTFSQSVAGRTVFTVHASDL